MTRTEKDRNTNVAIAVSVDGARKLCNWLEERTQNFAVIAPPAAAVGLY